MAFSPGLAGGRTPCRRTASAREFDRLGDDLKVIERDLTRSALGDEGVKRLMTIPRGRHGGGARHRSRDRRRGTLRAGAEAGGATLASTRGVRQSGCLGRHHGRITKQGRGHARGGACSSRRAGRPTRAPGPLRAFFLQVRARRGQHGAAVATAHVSSLCSSWHLLSKGESSPSSPGRPLHARKLRDLELKAGYEGRARPRKAWPTRTISRAIAIRGADGSSEAETAYARFVSGWNPRGPKRVRTKPQPRCDDEGCAARLTPRALLSSPRGHPCARGKMANRSRKKTLSDLSSRSIGHAIRISYISTPLQAGASDPQRSE